MKENNYPGKFIVIEGPDGAGTTTQSKKLADELGAYWTCEPTENKVGLKVEEMTSTSQYSAQSIALAFASDRMLHLENEIIPKLDEGETVICDRYYHSSLVYQAVLGAEFDWVKKINRYAVKPDLTVILDISADKGMARVSDRGHDESIFEELNFQEKVVSDYRQLSSHLSEEIVNVDSSNSIGQVFSDTLKAVETAFD